jgi:hypothetical protein
MGALLYSFTHPTLLFKLMAMASSGHSLTLQEYKLVSVHKRYIFSRKGAKHAKKKHVLLFNNKLQLYLFSRPQKQKAKGIY